MSFCHGGKRITYARETLLKIRSKCESSGLSIPRKIKRHSFYFHILRRRIPVLIGRRFHNRHSISSSRKRLHENLIPVKKQQVPRSPRLVLSTFLYSNVRSLFNKIDEASILLRKHQVDVAIFVETWLHHEIPDESVSIDDFDLIRQDRELGKGGGIIC